MKRTAVRLSSSIGLLAAGALVGGLLVAASPAAADVVNLAPVRRVTGLAGPTGIAVDAAGNVYIASPGADNVRVFGPTDSGDAATADRTLTAPVLEDVRGVDVDAGGSVYASTNAGTIAVFAPGADGADPPVRTFSSGPGVATAIDVVAGGQVVVRKSTAIAVYTTTGTHQRTITGVPSGTSVAVGPDGTLWAGAYERIVGYARTANGAAPPVRDVKGAATGLPGRGDVNGLAFDPQGRLYATGVKHNAVRVYAASVHGNDAPVRTLAGSQTKLTGPMGVAVAADRRVFVSMTEMHQAWNEFPALLPATSPPPPAPPKPVVKVPGKPRALKVAGARAAKKRTIRWSVPASNGGARITGYRLVIKKGSRTLLVKNLSAGKRSYKVKRAKLRTGKNVVYVKAKNTKGYGAPNKKAFRVRKP